MLVLVFCPAYYYVRTLYSYLTGTDVAKLWKVAPSDTLRCTRQMYWILSMYTDKHGAGCSNPTGSQLNWNVNATGKYQIEQYVIYQLVKVMYYALQETSAALLYGTYLPSGYVAFCVISMHWPRKITESVNYQALRTMITLNMTPLIQNVRAYNCATFSWKIWIFRILLGTCLFACRACKYPTHNRAILHHIADKRHKLLTQPTIWLYDLQIKRANVNVRLLPVKATEPLILGFKCWKGINCNSKAIGNRLKATGPSSKWCRKNYIYFVKKSSKRKSGLP